MFKNLLRVDRFPTMWCPGCGLGTVMIQLAKVMDELGLDHTNSTIICGIGCTGRMAGYFQLDGVHTLHGRALPVAEAVKMVNPDLNVIVVSGDGDLASIGGNHLVHSARRNANLTVICNDNNIYGLTGGQAGPTTPKGTKTVTSPKGEDYEPINLQSLVLASAKYFYAKTTTFHQAHLHKCMREAINWPGFAFVDIASQCIENNGRRLGFNSAWEMLQHYRKTYKRAPEDAEKLGPGETGIVHRG
jgi:2-oxoglutarate ferredoxin oxidoreductase subunit beta